MPEGGEIRSLPQYIGEERRLRREEGQVVKTQEIDFLHLPTERSYDVSRLADFAEITFFSLGPLYVALNLEFDILETFAADTQMGRFERHTIYFGHPVIEGLGEWSLILQGVPTAVAMLLFRYLDTQTMLRRRDALYSVFMRRDVTLLDPYAVDRHEMTEGEAPARITVYVPSTNHWHMDIAAKPLGPEPASVRLQRMAPVAEIVRTGAAVLSTG